MEGVRELVNTLAGWADCSDALLGLLPMNKEELVGDVIINGNLGYSNHKTNEQRMKKVSSRVQPLGFKRAYFSLFRKLVGGIVWKSSLKGKGAQESWQVFKASLLQSIRMVHPNTQQNE